MITIRLLDLILILLIIIGYIWLWPRRKPRGQSFLIVDDHKPQVIRHRRRKKRSKR